MRRSREYVLKDTAINEETRTRRLVKIDRIEKGNYYLSKYSNYINFALVPLVSLIMLLVYYRQSYNFTEHLVANFYVMGMNALFFIVVATPLQILLPQPYNLIGIGLFFLWEIGYRAVFYYRFIGKGGAKYICLAAGASLLISASWIFTSRAVFNHYVETGKFL